MTVILAIDVGNTNIVVGAYDKDRLIRTWRLVTVHDRTEDELAVMLDGLLAQEDLALDDVDVPVGGRIERAGIDRHPIAHAGRASCMR